MPIADWVEPIKSGLAKSEKGIAFPNHANVCYVLHRDPAYGPERIWHDEFHDKIFVMDASGPRAWRDDDDIKVAVDLQGQYGIRGLSAHVVAASVAYVARQRSRHVVRDHLRALIWDGVPRIDHAFEDHWGAPSDDYTRCASRNFFLAMVARVLKPGCKVDEMVVFEGPQGIRKSSALQLLGGAWYSVAHESVASKDFRQGMRGMWLIEIAELQSFTRADITAVKNMLSAPSDDYRPSYGRVMVVYPRQCIMAGTTNSYDWGGDETGLRRFWPIRCGPINLETLALARPQLFAEAVARIDAGETWWEMPARAHEEQADRQYHDSWTDDVLKWCNLQPSDEGVTIREVLTDGLKIVLEKRDKRLEMRVARILRLAGWERKKVRVGQLTDWRWKKGENNDDVGNSGNDNFLV